MRRGGLPGHMAKARRIAREKLNLVDVVLEVVDARAPLATHSAEADTLGQRKPRVVVMSHGDLAEDECTALWIEYWHDQNLPAFAVDAVRGSGVGCLQAHLKRMGTELNERLTARGRRGRPLRAIVVGLPNVGKSSLLNRLTKKAKARTGARPGITRGEQWLRSGRLELLDLPGMLPVQAPDDDRTGRLLATVGVLPLHPFDGLELAVWLLGDALDHHADELARQAGVPYRPGEELEFLRAFAHRRGRLTSGGEPELEDAALLFVREFQKGSWGRFTLEKPPEAEPS